MTRKYLNIRARERIIKKYKELFTALEEYDKTKKLPFQKERIDITLTNNSIRKLRAHSEKIKKPMSHIIEELIGKCLAVAEA